MEIRTIVTKILYPQQCPVPAEAKGHPIFKYEDDVGKLKIRIFNNILIPCLLISGITFFIIGTIKMANQSNFSKEIISDNLFIKLLIILGYLNMFIAYMFVSLVPFIQVFENGVFLRDYSLINRMRKKDPDFIYYHDITQIQSFPHGLQYYIFANGKKYKIQIPMARCLTAQQLKKYQIDYMNQIEANRPEIKEGIGTNVQPIQ